MSAPGGILMAKIIMPDEPPRRRASARRRRRRGRKVDVAETFEEGERPANIIMAAAQGAQTGVKLAVAVGAMVLAFVALVALANGLLGGLGNMVGFPDLSFQRLVGYVFAPIMYPDRHAVERGGRRRRPVRHQDRAQRIRRLHRPRPDGRRGARASAAARSSPSRLCGFANFSSIAIQMAVTGGLAPNQRPVIARLGIRALLAGSLANLMSAALWRA